MLGARAYLLESWMSEAADMRTVPGWMRILGGLLRKCKVQLDLFIQSLFIIIYLFIIQICF